MDLSTQMLQLLPKIMRVVRREIHAVSKSSLSIPQFRILGYVDGGVRQVGQLADLQGVSQPTMSKLVNSLVAKGLVGRAPHSTDRRRVELHLTPKGEKLYRTARERSEAALRVRLSKLKASDREFIAKALSRLSVAFEESGEVQT